MEDILASIRRILNDDEEPAGAQQAEAASAADDDVFVLDRTMLIDEPASAPVEQPFEVAHRAPEPMPAPVAPAPQPVLAMMPEPEPEEVPEPAPVLHVPAPPAPERIAEEPLLAPSTAAAAHASMGALVRVVGQQQTSVYRGGGPTLEDMVRDELRPMVKSWLDENLAPMVERLVRAEIARVTGGS